MQTLRRLSAALLLALCAILLISQTALACGGLFVVKGTIDQQAERHIFSLDKDSMTMYEQISYNGSAEDFAWVLPVAVVPKVETADPQIFQALDTYTSPSFTKLENPPCGWDMSFHSDGATGGAPPPGSKAVDTYGHGNVGPYAYDVIRSSQTDAVVKWLQDHGYHVPDSIQSQVQPYVDEHMFFLAMRLRPEAGSTDIRPVKLTFPGAVDKIRIPLHMAAATASQHTSILLWFFSQNRVVPQNYQSVELKNQQFLNLYNPVLRYQQLVDQTVSNANGHAFVTDYANATTSAYYPRDNKELAQLYSSHPYLTRLYTRLSPADMDLDPVFAQQPGLANVSNYHSYSEPDTCSSFGRFQATTSSILAPIVYYGFYVLGPFVLVAGIVAIIIRMVYKSKKKQEKPSLKE